jgi:hypothetical protein
MTVRASRRQRARARREVVLGLGAGAAALAIAGGAGWAWWSHRGKGLDAQLCPAGGPTGHVVLLVDKTDPLTFTQKQAFQQRLRDLVARRTPQGTLLSVFVLGESFRDNAQALAELCNPGDGAGASELTANPAQLRRQYDERFIAPLMNEAEALQAVRPAKWSPIFEMLQLVGINGFQARDVKGPRRLVVMSDLLHNTPELSMYRALPDFDAFARTDYAVKSQARLDGVAVELDVLMNTPALQTRRLLQFWERWFDRAGAHVERVDPLEG